MRRWYGSGDGTAKEVAALALKDMLEAMKVVGNQVAVMTQLFTPLVNSSVGKATPVATTTPVANSPVSRPTTTPRVDELSRDDGDSESFDLISGNF
ncbi:hypothetical protein DY000_02006661 [Brassica cretica]|uniref:Uncharacterized protein n=1 Tax=Brassica cretica TaxID=69181 RepID=A0ABQ7CB50_BRACR|nr:hypothetical protein DY000_02006661 [Brassica cretica]